MMKVKSCYDRHLIHLNSSQPNSSNLYSENSLNGKRFQDVKDIKNVTIKFNAVPFDTSVWLSDSEKCAVMSCVHMSCLTVQVCRQECCCYEALPCWTVVCIDHSLLMVEHCSYGNSSDSLHNPHHCHLHIHILCTLCIHMYYNTFLILSSHL